MQPYDNDSYFKLNSGTVYTLINDEAVLLNTTGENLYGANPMATKILQMLDEKPISIALITRHILDHYVVEETECVKDVTAMIAMLYHEKLISMMSE